MRVFYALRKGLLYAYLGARYSLASEVAFLYLLEAYNAVLCSVNSVVAANERAWASNFSATGLTYEYFASAYFLTTKALNAKASAGVVVDVLA